MTILDQAEELRQQAIGLLLNEREQIDLRLNQLGYEKAAPGKKRGRPPKLKEPLDPSCRSSTSDEVGTSLPSSLA